MNKTQDLARKSDLRKKIDNASLKLAVIATPIVLATSAHADESNAIDMGTLGLTGLATAAATVFAIKASPSLMMWGYRKVLGFIGR